MNFDQPFFKRNFIGQEYIVHDTSSNSPYIDFPDMPTYIGGGVSIVKFYPSTVNLHTLAALEAEVLDANGNAVRTEISDFRDRFGNYYLSIHVNDSTAEGYGSISFVGVANATPDGEYLEPDQVNRQGFNLIVSKPLLIQPFERNNSPLVFDEPPIVDVATIIAPVRLATADPTKPVAKKLVARFTASFATANAEGFDKVAATSQLIQDPAFREFAVKNATVPTTTNQVPITVRQNDYDLENGQLINDTNRYNTIITITGGGVIESAPGSPFSFTSNLKGAQITLNKYNTYSNVTRSLSPTAVFSNTNPYNELEIPGQTQSLNTQLNQYLGTIVRVLTTSSALIDLPLKVNIDSYSSVRKNPITRKTTHTFRQAKNIRVRSEYYNPDALAVSQNISQSYIQFTFQSLQPIGGNVYRIKTYYRQNGFQQHDYALLSDQRVGSTEYLTDANSLNKLFYGKEITPFLMTGHFNIQSIITSYWKGYSETKTTIDTLQVLRNETILMDSAKLPVTNGLATSIFTTTNYQIYQQGQTFSFSFICTLEPNTTLEVYANSKLISTQLYNSSPFAQAFETSRNNEKARYPGSENRFGKYIGKIVNSTDERKDYGRVIFDVVADYEGYGRPLFRVKSTNQTGSATAYLSEISVTPLQRNGYTPEIYQYNVNAPEGFQQLISESVDFKFEYFDYTGNQSEYVTYLNGINLNLQTEIQSSVCQIEKYKFVFNPTVWSIVTESATFRHPFVAPYGLSTGSVTSTAIIGTGSTSNAENINGFRSHSFAQIGLTATAPFIYPNNPPTAPQEDYLLKGWGRDSISYLSSNTGSLNVVLSGSIVQNYNGGAGFPKASQQRRYFPAYDHMRALTSFHDAYGRGFQTPDQDNFLQGFTNRTYGYGVGSTYRGPVTAQHYWSGWNALRPWKPIYANRWLNKTSTTDVINGLYGGKFYYTSSWEIFPALGQGVYYRPITNGTSLRATSYNTSAGPPGVVRNTPIVGSIVTASWKFFDEFSEKYDQIAGDAMYIDFTPAYALITASYNEAVISASYKPIGTSLTSPSVLGTSSIDLSYPVNSGAAGITRFDVSQSYVTTSGAGFTTSQKATAYKQRRFYFPQGGPLTGSVFTENGGIYNVKFRLKRYQSGSNSQNWFSPDTGSYLMVYIFDVSTQFTTASEGLPGYYPPPQNIVKIGNQVTTNGYNIPPIQFYDSVTGYLYDEYEINLIQYGTPGQLVFEPSGDPGSYFGCAVDSVEFCKIGTTTDPYYTKPPADDLI